MPRTWDPGAVPPHDALRRLMEGNRRFLEGAHAVEDHPFIGELADDGQTPFAVILGCADSRVPPETIFDQGLGDLFVVRVAGHVVAPSIVGSVEFAVSQFGTRLVVVMGHTRCGAVSAAIRALSSGGEAETHNLLSILDRITPHIRSIVDNPPASGGAEALTREAVRANVRASVSHLRHGSRLLEELVDAGRVVVVGAEYELETGRVLFFDHVPPDFEPKG